MVRKHISSSDNSEFKLYRSLIKAKVIRKHGLSVVSGRKFTAEAIALHPELAVAWLSTEQDTIPPTSPTQIPHLTFSATLFNELDQFGTKAPLLVIRCPEVRPFAAQEARQGIYLFLPFQQPDNLGAAIRNGLAFGATHMVLHPESAYPFHPKCLRSSAGTALRANLLHMHHLDEIAGFRLPMFLLDLNGQSLAKTTFPEHFALLTGIEGPGADPFRKLPNIIPLHIPMAPGVESLNANAAVTVALAQAFLQKMRN